MASLADGCSGDDRIKEQAADDAVDGSRARDPQGHVAAQLPHH